jgi:hypothetical protein
VIRGCVARHKIGVAVLLVTKKRIAVFGVTKKRIAVEISNTLPQGVIRRTAKRREMDESYSCDKPDNHSARVVPRFG